MPNESGPLPRMGAFGENKPLSADELRKIVAQLATRIIGDNKTIKVRAFPNGQICIEGMGGGPKGMGGYQVPAVNNLPAIPSSGMREVYWNAPGDHEDGTGDGQIWRTYAGMSVWYATQKTTTLIGAPGS